MKPRITVITLGVDVLERAVRFYRDGLGFATEGIVGAEFEHGGVAFFDLQPGLRLALWPRSSIAHDSGIAPGAPSRTELTIGHNLGSRAEVDAVMAEAEGAGASIVKPAHDTFWGGYAGYFSDPDGHLWEVVWNPQWQTEEGPDDVEIRVANRSTRDFDRVLVNFYDDLVEYGAIRAGGVSEYRLATGAYRYAYVEVRMDTARLVLQPIDFVGETPLEDGRYTYALSVSPDRNLILELERD